MDIFRLGLSAQTETAAAAAGLMQPMNIQNLAALAAITQPSLQAAAQQPNGQLTNAAALLCKYRLKLFFKLYIIFMYTLTIYSCHQAADWQN